MQLTVTGHEHEATRQWHDALASLVVRHPNGRSTVLLKLLDAHVPTLVIELDSTSSTRDPAVEMHAPFTIANVALAYFPGPQLARQWFAAAWAGYCQHEALELVSAGGQNPLDPHTEPYETNPCNRGLRDGMPPKLTKHTIISALAVVMDYEAAIALTGGR